MIRFLVLGLLRDKHRSWAPVVMVALGVALSVLLEAWMSGARNSYIETNALLSTGHVKVQTAKAIDEHQEKALDLALLGLGELVGQMEQEHPDLEWVPRLYFGGLLDASGPQDETGTQAPVAGMGFALRGERNEVERLKLKQNVTRGHLPDQPNQVLVSDRLFVNLGLSLGQWVTLIGSDFNGSMAVVNLEVVGTLRFGVAQLDKGALVMDLGDAQRMLALEDGATELLGYFKAGRYFPEQAAALAKSYNLEHPSAERPFGPKMLTLEDQNDLETLLETVRVSGILVVWVFVLILGVLLLNAGLMGGVRRYGELGLRLALGESKGHLYLSLLVESLAVGIVGCILGLALGLPFAFYLQNHGLDLQNMITGQTAMLLSDTIRAEVSLKTLAAGLLPGLLAPLLGASLAGLALFGRDTSQLFKELETM